MKQLHRSNGGVLALVLLLAASCGGGTSATQEREEAGGEGRGAEAGTTRSVLLNAEGREALGLVLKEAELRG